MRNMSTNSLVALRYASPRFFIAFVLLGLTFPNAWANEPENVAYIGVASGKSTVNLHYLGNDAWGSGKKNDLYAYCFWNMGEPNTFKCSSAMERKENAPDHLVYQFADSASSSLQRKADKLAKELKVEDVYSGFLMCIQGCQGIPGIAEILLVLSGD